jgi:uncharacterized membrane protein YhaH (DUF805 family)
VSFPQAVRSALSKYATFSGRARRSEFWWFYLFMLLVWFAAAFVDAALGAVDGNTAYGIVMVVAMLALLMPYLAVGVRRLHDIGRPGWLLLIGLIPVIGSIVLLIFFVTRGEQSVNKWGEPLEYQDLARTSIDGGLDPQP